jgi:hypothetical protein
VALADFGGHRGLSVPAPDNNQWGFPGALRRHAGWEAFPDNWNMSDFFITAARSVPRLQLLQFNHAYDARGRFRLRQLGKLDAGNVDMLAMLRADQGEITRQVPSFRYFTAGGRGHGALPQGLFYIYSARGRLFRDWLANAAAGEAVPSVECGDCTRGEFIFSERDLRIVERALALLSTPGAWHSDEPPQRCGPRLDRFSLECALLTAVHDITGRANLNHAGAWEAIYTAMAKLGTSVDDKIDELEEPAGAAGLTLRLFNSRPGTTATQVTGLLQEVRDRIRADLRRNAK